MGNYIDCLFIGHNEMEFSSYESMVRSMNVKSEAYRDLSLNYIMLEGKPFSVLDAFNKFYPGFDLNLGDIFSATIAYLASYIYRNGYTFDYINSFQNQKNELIRKLKEKEYHTIAITTTFYVSTYPLLEIVELIKKYNRSAKIIIGGPLVATNARTYDDVTLKYIWGSINADYYVNSSQGEATLVKLINAVKNNLSVNNIDNIYYREKTEFIYTKSIPENNLLAENSVNWSLFKGNIGQLARIRTVISCPFSCSFCGFPEHAGKYQTIPVELVENELNNLKELEEVNMIHFLDDTFNVPLERFKEILKMMIKNKYNFKWYSYFRCQYSDRETIELMKESGCQGVFIGIESGNQQILDNMNKKALVEDYKNGLNLLKEYDILSMASFIVGFPGETYETYMDTVELIEEMKPDFYRAQLWYCEQITPIWQKKDKFKIKGSQFNWSHETMDSATGCTLIEDMVIRIKDSIWMPQYNYDIVGMFHMMQNGITIHKIKEFLRHFSVGVGEKLKNSSIKTISKELEDGFLNLFTTRRI